jgi:hypothetical protein
MESVKINCIILGFFEFDISVVSMKLNTNF